MCKRPRRCKVHTRKARIETLENAHRESWPCSVRPWCHFPTFYSAVRPRGPHIRLAQDSNGSDLETFETLCINTCSPRSGRSSGWGETREKSSCFFVRQHDNSARRPRLPARPTRRCWVRDSLCTGLCPYNGGRREVANERLEKCTPNARVDDKFE